MIDMNMCSISVELIPSSTSTPGLLPILAQLCRQSLPADMQTQTAHQRRCYGDAQAAFDKQPAHQKYCRLRFVEDLTDYLRCRFLPAENRSQAIEQETEVVSNP